MDATYRFRGTLVALHPVDEPAGFDELATRVGDVVRSLSRRGATVRDLETAVMAEAAGLNLTAVLREPDKASGPIEFDVA